METILYIILGGVGGSLLVWLLMKNRRMKAEAVLREHFQVEKTQLADELAKARQATAVAENQLQTETRHTAERMKEQQQQFEKALNSLRLHEEELRQEQQKQQEEKYKLVQEEIRAMATEMLNDSKAALNTSNKERMDALLTPLKERIEAFQRTVAENSKEGAQNKTEIKTAFEEAMKKLHDEQEYTVRQMKDVQERTVRELREQTGRIADDAAALTKALKGDSKLQGDWGEMVLEKTLEDCGLVKDEQYFLQPSYKDEWGYHFRPDAVIAFPNQERAVIDSKVSLTAYLQAVKADQEDDRKRLLRDHVASMRAHVNELADKNYEKLVPNCIGYVLMFVPYESGYSAAVKADASLLQYAYKRHIIILSPANLLMALQLTHTMWQNYRMNKNVEEILRQSNDLYDKFVGFAENFLKIERDIQRLHEDFDKAKGQLREGPGNVIRRLDNLKTLGITPKKQIPENL